MKFLNKYIKQLVRSVYKIISIGYNVDIRLIKADDRLYFRIACIYLSFVSRRRLEKEN